MKRNLYFETVYPRKNAFKEYCYNIFVVLSSGPKLVLEVFIRKNMGWRYFSISKVISISLFLISIPIFVLFIGIGLLYAFRHSLEISFTLVGVILWVLSNFITWLTFTVLFIQASKKRYMEVRRDRCNFDLTKFSLYTGDIHPKNLNRKLLNITNNTRTLRIFYEPLPFFVLGLGLMILGQFIGFLLFYCSIIYSLAYIGSINKADNYIADISDGIIASREGKDAFVNRKSPQDACGLEYNCDIPDDPEVRERLAREFEQDTYASFVF